MVAEIKVVIWFIRSCRFYPNMARLSVVN